MNFENESAKLYHLKFQEALRQFDALAPKRIQRERSSKKARDTNPSQRLPYPFKILLVLSLSSFFLQAIAQENLDKQIEFPESVITIEKLIEVVQSQTDFHFTFSNKTPTTRKLNFAEKKITLKEALQVAAKSPGIKVHVNGKKIILSWSPKYSTISGYVRDAESGENLIGASVFQVGGLHGVATNAYGYFNITLPHGPLDLAVLYPGFNTARFQLQLFRDTLLEVTLGIMQLKEVTITSDVKAPDMTQMSSFQIPTSQLKIVPALAGEVDIMKSLQMLPGVQMGTEGSTGLFVRGGSPDQNLILLDGVPVYNSSHLFGFFSVFNADAINNVELIKGGFPARYGGRLSSVIDISMKEGNRESFKAEGSVGLISSKLTVEGPILKNKASFIISGRRTYLDFLLKPFMKKNEGDNFSYYFYDLNAKLNYTFTSRSRLYLSSYTGNDHAVSSSSDAYSYDSMQTKGVDDAKLRWGNITTALRWNYVISPKVFSNVSATFSRYRLAVDGTSQTTTFLQDGSVDADRSSYSKSKYYSGILDYALKADFNFNPGPKHDARFGSYATAHCFSPGATTMISESNTNVSTTIENISAMEFGAYAEDDFEINPKLSLNSGFHFSGFSVEGKTFLSLQPRLSVRHLVAEDFAIKASYSTMAQYIHLLTNSGLGLPTDLWTPATARIPPQRSRQVAVGLTLAPLSKFSFSLETYYKRMNGVIEYRDGASYQNTTYDWQSKVALGDGTSYGAELFIEKKEGRWKGWLGYTLARSVRQFEELNQGREFPFRYDRRHDFELIMNREGRKNRRFSFAWVFSTGNAITIPTALYGGAETVYDAGYRTIFQYESRNNFRTKSYHRLDVSYEWRKKKRWGERSWIIGVYNAYSRRNPFYVNLSYDYIAGRRRLFQYGLFPIIPSFTYNFKFS